MMPPGNAGLRLWVTAPTVGGGGGTMRAGGAGDGADGRHDPEHDERRDRRGHQGRGPDELLPAAGPPPLTGGGLGRDGGRGHYWYFFQAVASWVEALSREVFAS